MEHILLIFILLLFWAALGALNYGATYAYFQSEYPIDAEAMRTSDRRFAVFMAVFGLSGTIAIAAVNGFRHGLRYR